MIEPENPFPDLPMVDFPPSTMEVSRTVKTAVRTVLDSVASEVTKADAHRDEDGRWSTVVQMGRRLIDDGRGGMTEPAEMVIAAAHEGRLAELLDAGPVEITDAGPMVTMSVTVPGHLAAAVRDAITAATPDAEVTLPRRSTVRTVTITTPSAPKTPDQ